MEPLKLKMSLVTERQMTPSHIKEEKKKKKEQHQWSVLDSLPGPASLSLTSICGKMSKAGPSPIEMVAITTEPVKQYNVNLQQFHGFSH